jgi:glycosyltransferase involved in cell wall biosynthesis
MWLYRRATSIVLVHEREKEVLLGHGFSESLLTIIPHGVCVGDQTHPSKTNLRALLQETSPRLIVLYAGTIGVVHGLDAFVKATADSRIRDLPVQFVFVGDGECLEECRGLVREMASRNVSLVPAVPLEEVPGLLAQADVLLCSFRMDAESQLGSKFYEYCAAGKPILVHGQGPASDLVAKIGNGLACTPGDVNGLASALTEFMQDPKEWKKRGMLGRQYAEAQFSELSRNDQWEALVESIQKGR